MKYIIQDTSLLDEVGNEWFDIEWLRNNNLITGHSTGRGTAHFVQHNADEFVLRHYMRGGLMARFSKDRYIWTGLHHTRPWKEWKLTNSLYQQGLPVPRPIAAQVIRNGILYQGNILTQRIPNSLSFYEAIKSGKTSEQLNNAIGKTIRKFHGSNLYHSDLNTKNILISNRKEIFIIDFDKCRIRPGNHWKKRNLNRLDRSIKKLEPCNNTTKQISQEIRDGYTS